MKKTKLATIALVVFLVACLTACGGENTNMEQTDDELTVNEQWAPDSEYYFENNVLKTKDAKIVITDVKVFLPENEISTDDLDDTGSSLNKKLIAYYYDFTNLSEREMNGYSAWSDCTFVFQNGQHVYDEMLNRSDWRGSNTVDVFADIQPGETAKCAVAYILDNEIYPVRLLGTKEQSLAIGDFSTKNIGIGELSYSFD